MEEIAKDLINKYRSLDDRIWNTSRIFWIHLFELREWSDYGKSRGYVCDNSFWDSDGEIRHCYEKPTFSRYRIFSFPLKPEIRPVCRIIEDYIGERVEDYNAFEIYSEFANSECNIYGEKK